MDENQVEKKMGDALFAAIVKNGTDRVTKDEILEFRSQNSSYTPPRANGGENAESQKGAASTS